MGAVAGEGSHACRRCRPDPSRRQAARPPSARVMLLCLSSRRRRSVFEESVEVAGEVALEAAVCLASGLAFLEAPFDVGGRRGGGGVVGFGVAAWVERVADGLAGGGGDRSGAGESCEGGLRSDSAAV